MKLSGLIAECQRVLRESGDVPVKIASICTDEDEAPLVAVCETMDDVDGKERCIGVLLCDEETSQAFWEPADDGGDDFDAGGNPV